MNPISAIFRVICGLCLIGVAIYLYSTNHKRLSSGGDYGVTLFGHATSLSPSQAMLIYLGAAFVGIIFIVLGIVSVLKDHNPKP